MIKKYTKSTGKDLKTNETIMGEFWEFCVRYIDDDGREKQKRKRNFRSEAACRRAMNSFLASKGNNTKREGLNFEYLFNQYKDEVWGSHRPNTIKTNSYWFDLYILPYFKNYLVSDISVEDIIRFQNKLRNEKKLKDNTLKNISAQLKSFLNYCVVIGKLDRIPFDRRRTAVKVRNNKPITIWDFDDFTRFITFYDNDIDKKALFYTLFFTGIRLEETLALEKKDFNFKNNSLTIMRTYQRIDGKDILEDITKTIESRRSLYLCDDYLSIMKEFFTSHSAIKDDERIFPYTQRRVYEWMKIGIEATGVPTTHPHALRNSLITNAIAAGIPIKAVQKYAGHGTSRTTLDVYAKSLRENEKDVGKLYSGLIGNTSEIRENKVV